jgi:hypothetical protein
MSEIDNLREHVDAALKLSGTKQRYSGVVDGYDQVGTTVFIVSGERKFLAFRDPNNPIKSGDQVTFRIDGLRAVSIQKIPAG